MGGDELIDFKGSNFYPFPPSIAKVLSTFLPTLSVSIFFLFCKKIEYQDEFIKWPTKNKLETNFFIGEYNRW